MQPNELLGMATAPKRTKIDESSSLDNITVVSSTNMVPADLPSQLTQYENYKIPKNVEQQVQNIELQDCLILSDEVINAPDTVIYNH